MTSPNAFAENYLSPGLMTTSTSIGALESPKAKKVRVIRKMSSEQTNFLENLFQKDPEWTTPTISKFLIQFWAN